MVACNGRTESASAASGCSTGCTSATPEDKGHPKGLDPTGTQQIERLEAVWPLSGSLKRLQRDAHSLSAPETVFIQWTTWACIAREQDCAHRQGSSCSAWSLEHRTDGMHKCRGLLASLQPLQHRYVGYVGLHSSRRRMSVCPTPANPHAQSCAHGAPHGVCTTAAADA